MSLWVSSERREWVEVFESYEEIRLGVANESLVQLDKWYLTVLPEQLRKQQKITQKQLAKLMKWKLTKGKWRPRLQKFIDQLTEEQVQTASESAFQLLNEGQSKQALHALCALKGVGPATASAVMAAFDPHMPFMGDEALEALSGLIGRRQYTSAHFFRFVDALNKKVAWLNEQNNDSSLEWNAQMVQLCLWAISERSKQHIKEAEAEGEGEGEVRSKKKRKL